MEKYIAICMHFSSCIAAIISTRALILTDILVLVLGSLTKAAQDLAVALCG